MLTAIMTLLKLLLTAACVGSVLHAQDEVAPTPESDDVMPPNVILLMTDDMGCGDFSSQGNTFIKTPNLDRLAKSSVRWKNFYVSPVCSPTRASVMTGRYNIRTKCVDTYLGRSMMANDEVTIAEALNGFGYSTGIFGKWHLGDNFPMRPSDQGYEESLIHRGGGLGQPSDPIENNGRYTDPILFHNDKEAATQGFCTDVFFTAAKDFITKSKSNQRPFFATITVNVPHAPFTDVPKELLEKFKKQDLSAWGDNPEKLASIAAMIDNLDSNVGGLLDFLKEKELYKNTIIIFLNDNGPNTVRFNKKMRGIKGSVYEGGIRSPLWIHWPEAVTKGKDVTQNVAAHIDIMPTILDVCGLGVPDAFGFDGRSLAKQIVEHKSELPVRPVVIQWHRGATPIRYHHFMVRHGDWKLVNPTNPQDLRLKSRNYELYNLKDDPTESSNLASQNDAKVRELLGVYEKWFDDVTESRIRDRGTPYILIDRKHENPVVLTWQDRLSTDWSYNTPGFWKLAFEHDARIDVLLESPDQMKGDLTGWKVNLTIGREVHSQPVGSDTSKVLFSAISAKKGKRTLKAEFVSPDGIKKLSAYQVRLIHR